MELATVIGRIVALALAAGVNVYATVALIGFSVRFGWVALAAAVPGVRLARGHRHRRVSCTCVEFFADKVPMVDTIWDLVHTAVRPIGGALIAVTTLGEASPGVTAAAALLGGAVATSSHLTKTEHARRREHESQSRSRTGRSAWARTPSSSGWAIWRLTHPLGGAGRGPGGARRDPGVLGRDRPHGRPLDGSRRRRSRPSSALH